MYVIVILILIAIVHFIVLLKYRNESWYFPINFFLIAFNAYVLFGIGVYHIREIFGINWVGNIEQVAKIALIAEIGFIIGCMFGVFVAYTMSISGGHFYTKSKFHLGNIKKVNLIFLVTGNLAAFKLFSGYRNIPLLNSEIDSARVELVSASGGFLWPLMLMLILSVPLTMMEYLEQRIYCKGIRSTFVLLLKICFAILPLVCYGGRFFMLSPFIISFLFYVYFFGKIRRINVFLSGAATIFLSMWFLAYRLYKEEVNLLLVVWATLGDFFPEMRTFAMHLEYFKPGQAFLNFFVSPISALIPSFVFEGINLNKTSFYRPIGGIINTKTSEFSGILGLRMSLIGESYLGGGLLGTLIVFSGIGIILGHMHYIQRKGEISPKSCHLIILLFSLIMMIPYGSNFFPNVIYLTLYGLILSRTISTNE